MGTRNLTAVYFEGEYRIAQYGQWDGYPEGQGLTALRFARKLKDKDVRQQFERKLRASRWITQEELDEIVRKIDSGDSQYKNFGWGKDYPTLTRDTGAEILNVVLESDDGIALRNSIDFAADSLFCEWAWVIDLDNNTFEGFEGFNTKIPTQEGDRFHFLADQEEDHASWEGEDVHYYCITQYDGAKWNLDDLPDNKAFLNTFKTEEE